MKPDYTAWDGIQEFSMANAACLCCDVEPENWIYAAHHYNPKPEIVRAMEDTLKVEVAPVTVETRERGRAREPDPWLGRAPLPRVKVRTYYPRAALRAWAERTGRLEAMPFLLTAAEREPPQAKPGPGIRADAERNMNALVGLLTLTLAKNRGASYWVASGGRSGPNLTTVARALAAVAKAEGLDTDGLSAKSLANRLAAGQAELADRRQGEP